jgi:hypothetical protein
VVLRLPGIRVSRYVVLESKEQPGGGQQLLSGHMRFCASRLRPISLLEASDEMCDETW